MSRPVLPIFCWLLAVLGCAAGLRAAEPVPVQTWLPAAGEWSQTAHWSAARLPTWRDEVRIDGARAAEIATGDAAAGKVRVGVTAGSEARLSIGREATLATRILVQDSAGEDTLAAAIGEKPGAHGEVTVAGRWTNEGSIFVGIAGHGRLQVEAGATVHHVLLILGSLPGSSAEMELRGEMVCENAFGVGDGGQATLRIAPGGVLRYRTRWGVIGSQPTSVGQLEVRGSLEGAAESDLIVGNGGRGTLIVHPEGQVSGRRGWIASHAPGWGRATVAGSWKMSEELSVGQDGPGELVIEAGGRVTSGAGQIGFNPTGTGRAWVKGNWDCAGALYVGHRGKGRLDVETGGMLSTGSGIIASGLDQTGSMTITGLWENRGTLTVGEEGEGRLEIVPGGITRVAGDAFVGTLAGAEGRVAVAGKFLGQGDLSVGYASAGGLEIAAGGLVTAADAHVGRLRAASGRVTVAGTIELTGRLNVGVEGRGALIVEPLGQVNSRSAVLGEQAGAEAHATVRGRWRTEELTIGGDGRAGVTIQAGGRLEADQVLVRAGSALVLAGGSVRGGLDIQGGNVSLQGVSRLELAVGGGSAPIRFLAGSALIAGAGARLELTVVGENLAAGTHRLVSFAAGTALESVDAATFTLAGDLPAGATCRLQFSSEGLDLVVERR